MITYFATDVAGNVEVSKTLTVKIDTRKPRTKAFGLIRVHLYQYMRLRYEVLDRQPCSGKANVVIKIKTLSGKVEVLIRGSSHSVRHSASLSQRASGSPTRRDSSNASE